MRVTIGRKLFATFIIVFALTIINAVVIYVQLGDVRTRQKSVTNVRIPAILAISDIRIADQRMVNGLYGYIFLHSDPAAIDINKKQITQSVQRVTADLAKLRELSAGFHDEGNEKRIKEISDHLAKLTQTADLIEHEANAKGAPARHVVYLLTNDAIPTANEIRDLSKDLIASVNTTTDADNATLQADGQLIAWTLIVCTGVVVLLGGSASWKISRGIVIPLKAVVARAESIADGNLTGAELETRSKDEVANLAAAVNKMQHSLAETLQSVASAAEHVASASTEISANACQTASGAEAQRDQVHQIATAMQEMSATVREVSDNSNRAADSARQASASAREGGVIVNDTLARMRALAEFVHATGKKVGELGTRSDQIGKIIGVIDDIADQTNLLALNAAIEAARAGEQGRGFAVVADEVRKLAERTSKATKEIADMISAIQTETRDAVERMQSGTAQVESGVEATNRAGEFLKQIIGQADNVGNMIAQIATAVTEQSATTAEVNANMDQINQLVVESADGAQQSAEACEQLSGFATEMQHLVSRFCLARDVPQASLSAN